MNFYYILIMVFDIIECKCLTKKLSSNYKLIIKLTNYCNFNCWYCNDSHKNKKENYIDINIIALKYFLDYCENLSIIFDVILTGGEPTLHNKFIDIIKLLNSYKIINNILLISNGSKNVEFYKNYFKNSYKKTYLRISYHPNNQYLSIMEYQILLKNLKKYNTSLLYLIDDTKESVNIIEKNIVDFKSIVNVDINPMYRYKYDQNYANLIIKYDNILNITNRNKEKYNITHYELLKHDINIFRGFHCDMKNKAWLLDVDLTLYDDCDINNKCNIINKKSFNKFYNICKSNINICNSDNCASFIRWHKWKD